MQYKSNILEIGNKIKLGQALTVNKTSNYVGIGETNPGAKLEVAGTAKITGEVTLSNYGAGYLKTDASGVVSVDTSIIEDTLDSVTDRGATTTNAIQIGGFTATGATNYIGTENANNGTTTLVLRNYDTTLVDAGDIQGRIQFTGRYWSGSTNQLVESRIEHGHQESDGNGGSFLRFMTQTGGSGVAEQMRINKVGNVGINQTDPGEKLDVVGNIKAQYNGSNYSRVGQNSSGGYLQAYSGAIEKIMLRSYGDSFINGGNVGIGTDSPINGGVTARWLTINGDNGSSYSGGIVYSINNSVKAYHYVQDNNLIHDGLSGVGHRFFANGSEKMRITSAGYVGIGETNPLVPLHISRDTASGENIALILDNNNTTAGNEIGMLFRSAVGSTNTDFEIFGKSNAANDMDLVFQSDGSVERVRFTADGKVGIGTDNPTSSTTGDAFLEVQNNGYLQARLSSTTSSAGIELIPSSGNNYEIQASTSGDFFVYDRTNSSYRLLIDSSGKVGIGTTSPNAKLEVNDSANNLQMRVGSLTAGISPYIRLQGKNAANTTNYYADIELDAENGKLLLNDPGTSGSNIGTNPMVINSAGDVGIGETNPDRALVVKHSTQQGVARFVSGSTTMGFIEVKDANTTADFKVRFGAVGDELSLWAGGGERMRIDSNGNVGIGTDNPGADGLEISRATNAQLRLTSTNNDSSTLQFADADDVNVGMIQYTHSDNAMAFRTNDGERMRIASNGNVGINETNPDTILHIKDGGTGLKIEDSSGTDTYAQIRFAGGDLDIYSRNGSSYGDIQWWRYDGVGAQQMMRLNGSTDRSLRLYAYGSGNITGTATKMLGVTSAGIVVEEALPKVLDRCSFSLAFKTPSAQTNYLVWWNGSYQAATGPEIYKTALYSGSIDVVKIISNVTVSGVYIDVYETGSPTAPIWSSGSTSLTANTVTSFSPSGATFSANDQLYVTLAIPTSATIIYRIDFGLLYD